MRHVRPFILMALMGLVAQTAEAQIQPQTQFQRGPSRQDRRLGSLLDQLREYAWSYRQELNFFQRAPEYEALVALRYHLRNKAARVVELEQTGQGDGPEQKALAREMQQYARDFYRLTRQLEERTDAGPRDQVRLHADSLTELAVEIRVIVGRLNEALHIDYRWGGRGDGPSIGQPYQPYRPGSFPQYERPTGREIR